MVHFCTISLVVPPPSPGASPQVVPVDRPGQPPLSHNTLIRPEVPAPKLAALPPVFRRDTASLSFPIVPWMVRLHGQMMSPSSGYRPDKLIGNKA